MGAPGGERRIQRHRLEQFGDPPTRGTTATRPGQPVRNVLSDGQMGEERTVLRHEADFAPVSGHEHPWTGHLGAVDVDAAGVRGFEPRDQPQQRGFPAPRRSDDRGRLAPGQIEIDAVEDDGPAERLRQTLHRCRDAHIDAALVDWRNNTMVTGMANSTMTRAYGAAPA